ncbi:unnamed protein product [Pleuronectes platessa]|uniref:Uncharacterized protein n=1 Tax=Pleuronectes platessa TaxID=8262 RepID=A0A9N7U107_PLEPL|nr:unnamed protein product [Pleuronectes platessa]
MAAQLPRLLVFIIFTLPSEQPERGRLMGTRDKKVMDKSDGKIKPRRLQRLTPGDALFPPLRLPTTSCSSPRRGLLAGRGSRGSDLLLRGREKEDVKPDQTFVEIQSVIDVDMETPSQGALES